MVRVGEVAHVVEEHGKMCLCVSEGNAEQDPLLALPSPGGALNIAEIVMPHGVELCATAEEKAESYYGEEKLAEAGEDEKEDNRGDGGYHEDFED